MRKDVRYLIFSKEIVGQWHNFCSGKTHSSKKCENAWNNQWGRSGAIRFSHRTRSSMGVFIAFHEHLDYKILEEYAHDGRTIMIHSLIQDMLVNYYALNTENEQAKY